MAPIPNISDLVEDFVSGKLSASDFANNFAPIFKSALKSRDGLIRAVALAVHSEISHYFNGLIPEPEFRASVDSLMKAYSGARVSVSYGVLTAPFEPHHPAFVYSDDGELIPV